MEPNNFGRPNEIEEVYTALTDSQQKGIDKFVNNLEMRKYSKKTVSQYRFYLIHLHNITKKDYLGMNKEDVEEFLAKISSGGLTNQPIAGSSLRMIYSLLNSFFFYHNRGELRLSRKEVRIKRTDERDIFTIDERDLFFKTAEEIYGIGFRAFVEFSYWEGLRINEAMEMRTENIDFLRDKVKVTAGKGNKDATIDLLPKAKEILERYMQSTSFRGGQKYLFEYKYKKGKLAGKSDKYYMVLVETMFQKVLSKMNMGKLLTFHCLRHSCGSHLLSALGESGLPYVRKHLRHEVGSPVTLRYLHVVDKGITDEQLSKIGGA